MYQRLACFLLTSCCLILPRTAVGDDIPASGLPTKDDAPNYLSKPLMKFTSDMLKSLPEAHENVLFSPVNIYSALSMVQLGAANTTRDELTAVLGWQKSSDQESNLHESFGKMLKSYGKLKGEKELTRVNIANGIFVQKSFPVKDTYLKEVEKSYKGEVRNLDFTSGEEATNSINKWASNATDGRIPKLFSEPVRRDTLVLIATSLYFNGRWDEAFPKFKTRKESFTTPNGTVEVQMMNQIGYMPYVDNSALQFQATQLYYDGGDYSMFFILPYASQTLANLTKVLEAEELQKLVNQTQSTGIDCKIPRIKFSVQKSLVEPLKKQGLTEIFNHADLSNMIAQGPELQVTDIKHATEIDLDEYGTKASAITAVQISYLSGPIIPRNPTKFYVNRPFMFGLYHHITSSFLFVGLVNNPAV